VRRYVGLIRQG